MLSSLQFITLLTTHLTIAFFRCVVVNSESGTSRSIREIQFHDLRHLENQFHTHEEPTVIVRRHAVLISLNPLRAIVTADRLILIVPDGADSLLYMLHDYMHGKDALQ
jgi:hypothetical protein